MFIFKSLIIVLISLDLLSGKMSFIIHRIEPYFKKMKPEICPFCQFTHANPFYRGALRSYLRCPRCKLIFVSRKDLLSNKQEKARYDLHENSLKDKGYRQFLNQFIFPLLERIGPPPQKGLDFGSGPGPVLSMMLESKGYQMALYDPYYAPNEDVLKKRYDFVTCTETIEHFHDPGKEWRLLLKLVKPSGWLGIMTQLVEDIDDFPNMHYITDMTHVSFFSHDTFRFLAKKDNLHVEFQGDNLIFCKTMALG